MDKLRGKNVTFLAMQDELDECQITPEMWKAASNGIICQLDIANSTVYSKITEKTIKEALISLTRTKKRNGRL